MSREGTPRPNTLLRWLVGLGLGLVLIDLIFWLVWGQGQVLAVLPWLTVVVDVVALLTAFAAALAAFNSYRAVGQPTAFWIGTGFTWLGVFLVFHLLAISAFLPGEPGVGYQQATQLGWFWYLTIAGLAVCLLIASVAPWPRGETLAGPRLPLVIAAEILLAVLVGWLSVSFESFLPHIRVEGVPSPSDPLAVYALLAVFLVGTLLSARRYHHTGDPIVGYLALTQLVLAFVTVTAVISLQLYDTWWYWERALWFGAFWLMLFGLLSEYARLSRRERETAEELREFESRLSLLWQRTPLGAIEWDSNWRVMRWNPAAERIFGYTEAEAFGQHASFIVPAGEREPVEAVMRALATNVGGERHINKNVTKDGRTILCDWYNTPLTINGRASGVMSLVDDITERRRGEEALRDSEERFRVVFEQAAVGIGLVAIEDGRFLRANQRLCDIVGYSSAELTRLTFADLTHPDDRERSVDLAERLLAGEIPAYSVEKRYVRRDGSPVWVNVTTSLVRSATGEPRYFLGVVEDIGRRKAIETERERLLAEQVEVRRRIEELAETAQRRANELQSVLDTMVEAVIVVNAERRIVLVNGAFTQMTGLAAPEIVGAGPAEYAEALRLRTPEGRAKELGEQSMSRALDGQTVTNEPAAIRSARTQRDVQIRVSAAPFRGPNGEITGAVVVARDVSELAELDRLKDQFIAVTAHELKTPITIMKGYAQTLVRTGGSLPPPQRRMLEAVSRGADRIDKIIVELLDVSRLMTGQLELALARFDLPPLIEEVVDRTSAAAPKHMIRLKPTQPVVVEGDRNRLEQVLVNLLDNAVRYSPAGGAIDVAVDVRDGEAVVSVTDQGVGIPARKQGRIFQRFYRAHTGTPYDYGGMGVGLYISREIVRRHGGRMWFESREGQGSVFSFSLPLARE